MNVYRLLKMKNNLMHYKNHLKEITQNLGLVLSAILFVYFFALGCASTTEQGAVGINRKQLLIFPANQIDQMAQASFSQVKKEASSKNALDRNADQVNRVRQIANRIIPYTQIFRSDAKSWNWEVHVISSDELNAFCMPGGKIIFYSGIIDKLKLTDSEIAAIMGHEIAHALREHSRERASKEMAQNIPLQVLVASGKLDPNYGNLAALGTNILLTLPNSREQESEADLMGLELMARAGYNPDESLTLWRKMASVGGGKPPEFLSTHPSDETRISKITGWLPLVRPLYTKAKR